MDFNKKLKLRLYLGITYALIGVALIITNIYHEFENEFFSSFGAVMLILGISKVVQYIRITKDKDSLHKRKIAETDERNVLICTKARSLTFTIYIIAAALSILILFMFNLNFAAKIVSYSVCSFVLINWICYFIISRKY